MTLIGSVPPMQSATAGAEGSAGPILIRVYIHVIQVSLPSVWSSLETLALGVETREDATP